MSLPTSAPREPDDTTTLPAVSASTAKVRTQAAAAAAAHAAHVRAVRGNEEGLVPAKISIGGYLSNYHAHRVIGLAGRKLVAAAAAASAADEAWLLAEMREYRTGLRLEIADSGSSGGLDSVREVLHPDKVQCGLARTGPGGHLVLVVYLGGAAGLTRVRTGKFGMELANLVLDVFQPGGPMTPDLTQFTHRREDIGRATALADIDGGITLREASTEEMLATEDDEDWPELRQLAVTVDENDGKHMAEAREEAKDKAKKLADRAKRRLPDIYRSSWQRDE